MKQFIWQYVKENRIIYTMFFLMSGLFLLTFFLYDLPLLPFKDGLMFVLFLLIIWTILDVRKKYKEHQALSAIIKQETVDNQLYQQLDIGETILCKDYHVLLKKVSVENHQLEYRLMKEQQTLLDYYAMWSHQIKTPLAALQVLVETEPESTLKIKNEISTIDGYLSMMLHYLKLTNLENDLILKRVEIFETVKKVVKKYRMFFIQKDLSVDIVPFSKKVITDEKWLLFILEQVIFNSIKYTKSGGVTIFLEDDTLKIKDSGIGILPQDLPRIFESGFTGFNGRQHQKATGLGLHMSQTIANQLGIYLEIDSKVGVGTIVSMTFSQFETMYE